MDAPIQAEHKQPVAATAAVTKPKGEPTQFLTFMLGSEVLAFGILAIKEIIECQDVTAVPMMPKCIRGVIGLRGTMVPVIDLAARFGRINAVVTKRSCIVIVEVNTDDTRKEIGVIVDAVNAVIEISDSDIEPPPAFGARIRTDFVRGVGKFKSKFVILLDADRVLSLDEIGLLTEPGDYADSHAVLDIA